VNAAVIAAGHGERLRAAGIATPKPLLPVAGVPLIDRVLGAVAAAGIERVACIFNREADVVHAHVRAAWSERLRLHIVRETTPSSMESLFALAPHLGDGRFLLLTVDALFGPELLASFLAAAERRAADGVLAVSSFVDDEKPLRVALDGDGRIRALGTAAGDSSLVTAGFYVFDPCIFREIEAARAAHFSALRQFLAHLVARGYGLYGECVGKTVDVDRAEDLAVAEAFVRCGFRS
jgi:NDP-sugar pyrophosphorylase family protein